MYKTALVSAYLMVMNELIFIILSAVDLGLLQSMCLHVNHFVCVALSFWGVATSSPPLLDSPLKLKEGLIFLIGCGEP